MICLSLDTTTRAGSVALVADDRIVEERRGDDSRSHGERLPSELLDVADAHGVRLLDVDLFAVAAGPGSFTGLRIGIATVQGLSFVTRRSVVAVSALEALAHIAAQAASPGTLVAAWIDAMRHDVYSAVYAVGEGAPFAPERVVLHTPPVVEAPAAILDAWHRARVAPVSCIGDGAVRYADLIERSATTRVAGAPLLAGAIGRIAVARAARGDTVNPAAIQPVYVRRPDAEVDRERRASPGVR